MKRSRIPIITGLLAATLAFGNPAHQVKDARADVALQAAIKKEMIDGDLKAAIEQYKSIVTTYAANHAVAAKALVRIGQCYEKLGNAEAQEARKAYEQVLKDYPDQKEAVSVARERLGRYEPAQRAGAMSSRQIWTPPSSATVYGMVSHDGRYIPYTDWAVPGGNGALFLHDTVSGTDRRITKEVEKFAQQYAWDITFSPDDTQLAYAWFNIDHHELRLIGLQGPSDSPPRILFSNPDVTKISPGDWSADGKWLAVQLTRKDKTAQIGLVAVKDGSLQVLKSVDSRGSSKMFFSPDGKYLAYDLPASETGNQRDIFVLSIEGNREIPAVVYPGNDFLMGWLPDGRHLLFTSDRTGSTGLWALVFVDGKPQGAPEQIKVDVSGDSMGLTSKGAFYSLVHHPNFNAVVRSDIKVAAFDFEKGRFLSTPELAVTAFVGANNSPAWSPDGKSLAFLSGGRGRRGYVIMTLSRDTGQLRELQSKLNIFPNAPDLRWSPDGLSVAITAADAQGRQGIFRIDVATGEAAPIVLSSRGPVGGGSVTNPVWAPDAKRFYYTRINRADGFTAIIERDLSSGNEKEVIRKGGSPFVLLNVDISPDGKYWAALDGDWFAGPPITPGKTQKWNVLLIPAGGGEPKELMRGESHGAGILMWAPDSRSFFVYSFKDKPTGDREVWRVAVDGTEPQKLDLNVNFLGPVAASDQQFHLHPDGKWVAFASTEKPKTDEVWALENFLPALNKRK